MNIFDANFLSNNGLYQVLYTSCNGNICTVHQRCDFGCQDCAHIAAGKAPVPRLLSRSQPKEK